MSTVLQSLQKFLSTQGGLAERWQPGLETQINVWAAGGEPLDGKRSTYSDGVRKWWSIRVPKQAHDAPEWRDYELTWPLEEYAEAIGCTGWDWQDRASRWVGFDFDAITGHAPGIGIGPEQLQHIQEAASAVPWVEVRKSTRGQGLHLYVHFSEPIPTANHTEHAALGRAVLGLLSAEAGFDFAANVDTCGGNLWIWHRHATPDGFALLKEAEPLAEVPAWRDHIEVITRRRSRTRVLTEVEELAGSQPRVPLDDTHKQILEALGNTGFSTIWVSDHHLVQTHTRALAEVHEALGLKGVFETASTGADPGKPNCFAFPLHEGAWKVYRFGAEVAEAPTWEAAGWTTCMYNRRPTLAQAARVFGGLLDGCEYYFERHEGAQAALKALGQEIDLPAQPVRLKADSAGRIIITVERSGAAVLPGWVPKKGHFLKTTELREERSQEDLYEADNLLRVLITPAGENAGCYIKSGDAWHLHPLSYAKMALQSFDFSKTEAERIVGGAVVKPWLRVCLPFEPEFPGGRKWNIGAPQLRIVPSVDPDEPHPHWDRVFDHAGASLTAAIAADPWMAAAKIRTGADYLRAWFRCVLREPFKPTPYLFLFGPENSGKSILWEAFELLASGVVKADRALTNQSGFNGELAGALLCVVEEADISRTPGVLEKIKDVVTSPMLSIRQMRRDTYMVRNMTHWIQTGNSIELVPMLPGETRITMGHVPALTAEIPKPKLMAALEAEAPAFLRTLLDIELPESPSRLRLPVVETAYKRHAQEINRDPLERFLAEQCHEVPGAKILFKEFWERFHDWLSPEERGYWTKRQTTKRLPVQFPTGAHTANKSFVGNLSWAPSEPLGAPWITREGKLLQQT